MGTKHIHQTTCPPPPHTHSPQDLRNNRAYFITDSRSQAHCLVDTGAACSIWPLKLLTEKPPVSPITLQVVNYSPIPTYGQISRSLDLELRRDFTWVFTVADLPYPILDSDFLHHFNLLADMRIRRLIKANTELSVTGFKANPSPISPVFFIAATDEPYQTLLRSYPGLTNLNFVVSKPTHSTTRHIETTGAHVFSRPRNLHADKLKAEKAEFNHMLQLEIIRPRPVHWLLPCIWFRSAPEIGVRLGTIDDWMPWWYQIVTQSHIYRTSLPLCMVGRPSPN